MRPWNSAGTLWILAGVCVWKMAPVGQIRGPFLAQIGQYIGFRLFSWKVSTGFTRSLLGLLLLVCKRYTTETQFFGPFWASKWVKIQVSDYFVKTFLLDSHQSCFICSLELLSEMCTIWATKAQLLGHFGPQSESKLWTLVTFQDVFTSVLLHMLIASTFNGVWNMGLRDPILGPFWAPNKSKFRSLVIFS